MIRLKVSRKGRKASGVSFVEDLEFDVESINLNGTVYSGSTLEAMLTAFTKSKTILSQVEMAEVLRVSLPTMLRWEREGGMPVIRVPDCAPRYDRDKIFEWIDRKNTEAVNF